MILGQAAPAAPFDRLMGIRDRFATGGSAGAFFLVLALLALAFLLLLLIAIVTRRRQRRKVYNPKALFHEVLRAVPLTVPQRELLQRIARDLRMPHPVMLLICRQVYLENANTWMSASRSANPAMRNRLDGIAHAVFEHAQAASEG